MKDSLFLDICKINYRAIFKMIRNAMDKCPESLWYERTDEPSFWHQVYHTVFYIDFYLSESPQNFQKPETIISVTPDLGKMPENTLSQQQIADYMDTVSKKCKEVLDGLTPTELEGENKFGWTGATLAHRLIYNIRHAQHHVGRMNSILERKVGGSVGWVITSE